MIFKRNNKRELQNIAITHSADIDYSCRKLNISLCFLTQSYFSVPNNVRLNCTHDVIFKRNNKRELQNIAITHSADIDYSCRKLNISLCFLTQSYFSVPNNVRLNCTHDVIFKRNNKRELQNIAITHSADIDYSCRKLNISLCFLTQSYFSVPNNVRLNCTHDVIFKRNNKRELQNIANTHSADIDYSCRKLNISLCFLTQSYFSVPNNVRLNCT